MTRSSVHIDRYLGGRPPLRCAAGCRADSAYRIFPHNPRSCLCFRRTLRVSSDSECPRECLRLVRRRVLQALPVPQCGGIHLSIYGVGIQKSTTVWPEGVEPIRPPTPTRKTRGQPCNLLRRDAQHQPVTVESLAHAVAASTWATVRWREGTGTSLLSRFAALRIRIAHRDFRRSTLRDEEWLLIEWPADADEPTQYCLVTLPPETSLRRLLHAVKMRWRIERDYEEMKQELGLGHYEGRGWRGFHHHWSMCIAAYAFLAAERCLFTPQEARIRLSFEEPEVPALFKRRGSPVTT